MASIKSASFLSRVGMGRLQENRLCRPRKRSSGLSSRYFWSLFNTYHYIMNNKINTQVSASLPRTDVSMCREKPEQCSRSFVDNCWRSRKGHKQHHQQQHCLVTRAVTAGRPASEYEGWCRVSCAIRAICPARQGGRDF